MSALPPKADMCSAKGRVRFTPDSDRESGFPKTVNPLYPRKQTCAVQPVMSALGQQRTHAVQQTSFDNLVGESEVLSNDPEIDLS